MSLIKKCLAWCAASLALCTMAGAASYPARPVTVIVPFAAGGPTDSAARIIADGMQRQTKQTFVIENVGGAGSTLGATKVAQAQPDGYTLLFATSSAMAIAPHTYKNLKYDPSRSFVPVGRMTLNPFVLVTTGATGAANFQEFIAGAKASKSKFNYATPGSGTVQHVSIESLMDATGIEAIHVPYRGGAPALMALIQGDVQFLLDTPSAVLEMIKAGQLRALAVTGAERIAELPDVPTLRELKVEGADAYSWFGLFAPSGVPADVLADARQMLNAALADSTVADAMRKAGVSPAPLSGEAFARSIADESQRFGELIKKKNITAD